MTAQRQVVVAGDKIAHLREVNSAILRRYYTRLAITIRMETPLERLCQCEATTARSMNIFPVFALEQIREDKEEGQIKQHIRAYTLMLQFNRIG